MASKKILLLNGVLDGGVTYTEYLKKVSLSLPADADVVSFNIPSQTKLSSGQVAEILNRETHDIDFSVVPKLSGKEFDILFSNEAVFGQCIDESIRTVFVNHGSSAMPANSPFMFAEVLSFFDVITASSRASMQMAAMGLSLYRSQRNSRKIGAVARAMRSDLRQTYLMPTLPMKQEKRHQEMQAAIPARNFTIGLLPTSITAIQLEVSLYLNLVAIIRMLLEKFPHSRIVFRPYPVDLQRPQIKQLCDHLKGLDRVRIDLPDSPSSTFYDKCDLVITDASTGGVSFMLRKTVPPIYFVPEKATESGVTRWFVDSVRDRVPMAHTISSLESLVRRLTKAKSGELFKFYNDYCDKELFLGRSQEEYLANILQDTTYGDNVTRVDAFGKIDNNGQEAAA